MLVRPRGPNAAEDRKIPVTKESKHVSDLIRRLDADTSLQGTAAICAAVKKSLIEVIADGGFRLDLSRRGSRRTYGTVTPLL